MGGIQLISGTAERLSEIEDPLDNYDTKNICNVYESGIFYRMGPSRSYLASNEHRKETHGTELYKQKMHVTIVKCVNADGSHILPVNYIGKPERPICLRDSRYSSLLSQHRSQNNGWMNTNGFNRWINIWYYEGKKIS